MYTFGPATCLHVYTFRPGNGLRHRVNAASSVQPSAFQPSSRPLPTEGNLPRALHPGTATPAEGRAPRRRFGATPVARLKA